MKLLQSHITRVLLSLTALSMVSNPSQAAVELMDLITNNGSVVAGNIVFDQFSLVTSGDITPDTEVNVISIMDGNGNYGIRFQGGLDDLANNGPSSWTVSYQASSLDGTSIFTGATLSGNPAAPVSGSGSITLSADQITPGEYLNVFDDFNGGTSLLDSGTFANAGSTLDVSVEFLADAGSRGGVTASFIDQTFTQEQGVVPEMSSLATWTIMLFGATLIVGWRRMQDEKLTKVTVGKK